jgi:hypothetical protein
MVLVEDWHPLDGVAAPEYVPPSWNGAHVGMRLTDAWRTLIRMPLGDFGPRTFQHCWPAYRVEWDDLMEMIGAGELEAFQREQNRTREYPSAKQIAEMDRAFGWPGTYLRNRIALVLCLNVCCWSRASGARLDTLIHRRGLEDGEQAVLSLSWQACDVIARGLNREEVGVF